VISTDADQDSLVASPEDLSITLAVDSAPVAASGTESFAEFVVAVGIDAIRA
jgi:hypothetical protein